MRCFHRGMTVWRYLREKVVLVSENGCWSKKIKTRASPSTRVSFYFYFFSFSRPWTLWGLLLSSHQASIPNVRLCYLNSIRKSWLLNRRQVAIFLEVRGENSLTGAKIGLFWQFYTIFDNNKIVPLLPPLRYGVVGNISACHADARGSIPRFGVSNFFRFTFFW